MKLTFLPTLTDLREMLGDKLYVEFVWMWREQEQTARIRERREKWSEQVPARLAQEWPQPLFQRNEVPQPAQMPEPKQAQVALLHPGIQRILDQKAVNAPEWLTAQNGTVQGDEPQARERRLAAYRSAAE
jgi:hypothetical protein